MRLVEAGNIDTSLLMEHFEETARLQKLGAKVEAGGRDKWQALREIYRIVDPYIRKRWPGSYAPYRATDWRTMTPIEVQAWNAIRRYGLPFYPQYPVGKYFVDFGDPVRRLAVECDGKQWHNAAKDAKRDADLLALGWEVKRFTGWQCNMPAEDERSIDFYLLNLCEIYWPHGEQE